MLFKILVRLASLMVVTRRISTVLLENKYNGGYFKGEVSKVQIQPVTSRLECAFLCLNVRPLCQSFNVRPLSAAAVVETTIDVPDDGRDYFICEVLQQVPPSLTENVDLYFKRKAGAAYYEIEINSKLGNYASSDTLVDDSLLGQCWTKQDRINGSLSKETLCFEGHADLLGWDDARAVCVNGGGQLAEARNKMKHKAISAIGNKLIKRGSYSQSTVIWIGGQGVFDKTLGANKAANKKWTWQDGTIITNFKWLFAEPNENDDRDCLSILHAFTSEDLWQDDNCDKIKAVFVCEYLTIERL